MDLFKKAILTKTALAACLLSSAVIAQTSTSTATPPEPETTASNEQIVNDQSGDNSVVTLSDEQLDTLANKVSEQVLLGLQSPPASTNQTEASAGDGTSQEELADDIETIKDWTVSCDSVGENKERCYIYQTVSDESGRPVLQAAIGDLPDAQGKMQTTAIFTVPLGISLRSGMVFAVDGKNGIKFGFDQCGPVGCNAVLPLDKKLLSKFKAGNVVNILLNDGQQDIQLALSLQGFTKGLNRAKELSK